MEIATPLALPAAVLYAAFDTEPSQIVEFLEWLRPSVKTDWAPRRALDVGCGIGRLLPPLAARGWQVINGNGQSPLAVRPYDLRGRSDLPHPGVVHAPWQTHQQSPIYFTTHGGDIDLTALKGFGVKPRRRRRPPPRPMAANDACRRSSARSRDKRALP